MAAPRRPGSSSLPRTAGQKKSAHSARDFSLPGRLLRKAAGRTGGVGARGRVTWRIDRTPDPRPPCAPLWAGSPEVGRRPAGRGGAGLSRGRGAWAAGRAPAAAGRGVAAARAFGGGFRPADAGRADPPRLRPIRRPGRGAFPQGRMDPERPRSVRAWDSVPPVLSGQGVLRPGPGSLRVLQPRLGVSPRATWVSLQATVKIGLGVSRSLESQGPAYGVRRASGVSGLGAGNQALWGQELRRVLGCY